MTAVGDTRGRGRATGRVRVAGAIAGGLGLVAAGAVWIERRPIVAHFVDAHLAAARVPARYRLVAIGPFSQRLADIAVGDPAHPDLTARSVELTLGYDLSGPHLVAVRAEGVRLAARVRDGRVSLGALDRLLPAGSGGPFALPALDVELSDAAVALLTPAGPIDLRVDGAGQLSDGFRGRVRARAPALVAGGCAVRAPDVAVAVRIADGRPSITGPVALAGARCGGGVAVGAGRVEAALAFSRGLDRWAGTLSPAGLPATVPGAAFGALSGTVTLAGDARRMEGEVKLAAAGLRAAGGRARAVTAAGPFRFAPGRSGLVFSGAIGVRHATFPADQMRALGRAAPDTPLAPLLTRAGAALATLAEDADAFALLAGTAGGEAGGAVRVRRLTVTGRSGARLQADGDGLGWNVRDGGWRADGAVTMAGGGLPTARAELHQTRAGTPVTGVVRAEPYTAGTARLALAPLRFIAKGGVTRFAGAATLDGPLPSGRIEGLTLPVAGVLDARGLRFGEGCAAVSVRSVTLASAALAPARATLCGLNGAPVLSVSRGGRLRAGASSPGLRLAGRAGDSPFTLATGPLLVTPAGFRADALAARLGTTRLDVARLDGSFASGLAGSFAGAGGQVGTVPLLLADAAGRWTVRGGTLSLAGALAVSDAAQPARFRPLRAEAVTLTLADGRIAAAGTLHEPRSGEAVAEVTLRHDLSSARGAATFAVPALTFGPKLQPDLLTPATLGVIANVVGTVRGGGRLDWGPDGVTSSGDFASDRIDLAAAFGPVSGIGGQVHFSDLLALATPPHQQIRVAEINPGVAVTDGTVLFQLLPGERVAVEAARWPFAGGTLALAPTVLAFGAADERHLTYRLDGVDATAFVQQLDLPNLSATGTFDGTLPMVFDATGGRIVAGRIAARAPGGTLAYVGQLSQEDVGVTGRLAFDALKAIRYNALEIGLDGRLDGEIVSHVAFTGVREATPEAGFAARLIRNLPFRFNIAVRAPFRALAGTARSYADPSLLLAPGGVAVQPAASGAAASPGPR